jgi:sec-independent protein translocase protein TatB
MFDIGFWELAVIGVIALLVIGPERLPKIAYTAGLWFGKARRFVVSVKADIEQEVKAEELKQILKKQAESSGIHEIIEETRSTADELNKPVVEEPDEPNKPVLEETAENRRDASDKSGQAQEKQRPKPQESESPNER